LLNPSTENIAVESLKLTSFNNFKARLTERYYPASANAGRCLQTCSGSFSGAKHHSWNFMLVVYARIPV
jgi:hypothetical protein